LNGHEKRANKIHKENGEFFDFAKGVGVA